LLHQKYELLLPIRFLSLFQAIRSIAMQAINNGILSQAASALNVLRGTSLSPLTVFNAFRANAVSASDDQLRFADGSTLHHVRENSSFIAA
jgi:hypothetical protein